MGPVREAGAPGTGGAYGNISVHPSSLGERARDSGARIRIHRDVAGSLSRNSGG